jgi:hypothetical protein
MVPIGSFGIVLLAIRARVDAYLMRPITATCARLIRSKSSMSATNRRNAPDIINARFQERLAQENSINLNCLYGKSLE